MQLTKALVLVIVLAFIVSCKNRVPSQYPNKKEMTAILADLHMAEATIASQNQGGKSVEYTGFYKSVLDKHGLTKVQFDSALAWYTAHPSVYNELYDDVIAKLSDIEAQSLSDLSKLEEKEKELAAKLVVQSLWKDTAAIKYPYADTLDTRFPFEFVIDSLSGGDLRLNANYKFININKVTKVKYYMQLITCFADSTSDTLRTEVYRTLQGQATMLTAKLPGDKKLVKAKGFLLDHQKLDKPRVDISHMQLEFIPSGNINDLKKMTILSAHYAYAPNKSFIKNPLLYLDGDGKVERLESTGPSYKEVHSAQFFNGLIIPGFISDLRYLTIEEQLVFLKSAIFQHHANGTQFFIFSKSIAHSLPSLPAKGPTIIFDDELPLAKPSEKSTWEQLKQTANENNRSLTELLPQFIDLLWQPYANKLLGGAFSSGFTPGVFCISGIDWQNFRLTSNPQIKPLPIL